jgi:hypothetical protein
MLYWSRRALSCNNFELNIFTLYIPSKNWKPLYIVCVDYMQISIQAVAMLSWQFLVLNNIAFYHCTNLICHCTNLIYHCTNWLSLAAPYNNPWIKSSLYTLVIFRKYSPSTTSRFIFSADLRWKIESFNCLFHRAANFVWDIRWTFGTVNIELGFHWHYCLLAHFWKAYSIIQSLKVNT